MSFLITFGIVAFMLLISVGIVFLIFWLDDKKWVWPAFFALLILWFFVRTYHAVEEIRHPTIKQEQSASKPAPTVEQQGDLP